MPILARASQSGVTTTIPPRPSLPSRPFSPAFPFLTRSPVKNAVLFLPPPDPALPPLPPLPPRPDEPQMTIVPPSPLAAAGRELGYSLTLRFDWRNTAGVPSKLTWTSTKAQSPPRPPCPPLPPSPPSPPSVCGSSLLPKLEPPPRWPLPPSPPCCPCALSLRIHRLPLRAHFPTCIRSATLFPPSLPASPSLPDLPSFPHDGCLALAYPVPFFAFDCSIEMLGADKSRVQFVPKRSSSTIQWISVTLGSQSSVKSCGSVITPIRIEASSGVTVCEPPAVAFGGHSATTVATSP